jgi:hypothetical protein
MTVFRHTEPCSLMVIDRRFGGADCHDHRGCIVLNRHKSSGATLDLCTVTMHECV